MTIFNSQTNTCFATGMYQSSENDKSETNNKTYSSTFYVSNGNKPLITTPSKGPISLTTSLNTLEYITATSSTYSCTSLTKQVDISQQVGVLVGIDNIVSFENLSEQFKGYTKFKIDRTAEKKK